MSKGRILQFSAGFQLGDAISQEMLELKKKLKSEGYTSELYSENINKPDRSYVTKFNKADIKNDDVIVYHHSIHSDVLPFILKFKNKKILIYHNVTPNHFFEPYDLKFTYLLTEGRNDLYQIKDQFDAYFAVSDFNKQELTELGYRNVKLMPLNLNFSKWESYNKSPITKKDLQFLFVGRIAPNKKQNDLIKFAKIWKEKTHKNFHLKLIGFSNPNQQSYLDELEFMIKSYDLENQVEIVSYVNEEILSKYYRESNYFISMSEHEGFCVPLMEAMYFQLPVIAYKAGAIAETLGGSGFLFSEKNYEVLVDLILKLESTPILKETQINHQTERLSHYLKSTSIEPLMNYLEAK
ncbi:glycosyltransferase [Leptospira ognonensis]|uniref:Glycosyltransferase n=1 Tax=Leptospira ognonensis TaxID=2484945 RepID=A0A4R9K2R0_9LEPT|nr:glycosyltransferase [Leptospira ognonensis]TGL60313.1 glycosyltransferase [Leptospira ognonensis]